MTKFDAILFDAGGVFLLPDPTVLAPLLAPYGANSDTAAHVRAHYRGMAMKSAAGSMETFWHEYNIAYVQSLGVPAHDVSYAAHVLGRTRNAYVWRWPLNDSVELEGNNNGACGRTEPDPTTAERADSVQDPRADRWSEAPDFSERIRR